MMGLLNMLNLGAQSLSAQQLGTEIAGQNIANVNNPAYARESVVLQASTPYSTPIGQEGTGVMVKSIQEARDSFLDIQVRSEGSVAGSLTAQQQALQNAETALGEQITNSSASGSPSSPDGLTQGLANLFNSFQSLTTNPSSLAQRQVVVQTAQQLAQQFNSVSSQLGTIRTGLNSAITSDVTGANQDLNTIASLNQQIIFAQAGGGTANNLVDQREQAIEDLAGKINIATTANADGSMDVSIGGVNMVSEGTQADSLQTYDAGGGQILVRAKNASTQVSQTGSGGSINGDIDVRDGALAGLQTSVNTLAGQLIAQVNNVYSAGYDLNGNTGQKLFTGTDAATIGVNASVLNDPSTFQASGSATASGDNSVALALAQLADSNVAGLNNQTFNQSYAQTVAGLGQSVSSLNEQVTNSTAVSNMLTTQRSSVSGVSIDEEMTNLMQFQKAYEASAQLITTINQMLTTVIAMKTV